MSDAKITSKGQVTIPKDVRDNLGLRTGDRVRFEKDNGGYRLEKRLPENPFEKWRGYLKHLAGRDVDELIEEMRGPVD
jgi:AbrB family looped-hinge helix DNA binding protein